MPDGSQDWLHRARLVCHVYGPGRAISREGTQIKESYPVFDCHLHCPAEQGENWQWYKVTHNFGDFVDYLDKTGVQRGIINSQRSYGALPEEFKAGNREVARYVDKYKGRFLGACVVNPQYIEEALREIEYCRNQLGFVWVENCVIIWYPINIRFRNLISL